MIIHFKQLARRGAFAFACMTALARGADHQLDPRLIKAQQVKDDIASHEADVLEHQKDLNAEIDSAIGRFDPQRMETSLDVLKALKPAVSQLHDDSKKLVESEGSYLNSLSSLHKALVVAPDIYRTASDVFTGYVNDEPFDDLKNWYSELATDWRRMADTMRDRDEAIKDEGRSLVEFKRYLERTSLFLERLESHLDSFPDITGLEDRERYLTGMKHYVDGFEGLRRSLHVFHEKLNPPANAPSPDSTTMSSPFGSGTHTTWDRARGGSQIALNSGSPDSSWSRNTLSTTPRSGFASNSRPSSDHASYGVRIMPASLSQATADAEKSNPVASRPSEPLVAEMKSAKLGVVNDPDNLFKPGDEVLVRLKESNELKTASVEGRFTKGTKFVTVRW